MTVAWIRHSLVAMIVTDWHIAGHELSPISWPEFCPSADATAYRVGHFSARGYLT